MKSLLSFTVILLFGFSIQAQNVIKKKFDILKSNTELEQTFDIILDFEHKYVYGGIEDSRCYFVDISYDTIITINSMYYMTFFKYLSDSIYGMLIYRNHKIFFNHPLGNYLQKTKKHFSLNIDFTRADGLTFDDSETIWHFLLHNNSLEYQYVEGDPLERIYGIEPIEIIEEPVDNFPDGK